MKKTIWGLSVLLGLGLVWGLMTIPYAPAEETKEEASEEDTTAWAFELLWQAIDNYYDAADHGLRRAACFVKCLEIIKSLDPKFGAYVTATNFEVVIEPGKKLRVRARNIPAVLRGLGRGGIEMYRKSLESHLNNIWGLLDVVKNLSYFIEHQDQYEATLETEKKLTRITIEPKKTRPDEPAGEDQPKKRPLAKESDRADSETTIIWVSTKSCIIEKIESIKSKERSVISLKKHKYRKLWGIKQLDITKYDEEDRFDERTKVDITYVYPERIMMPSSLVFSALDKKGKPVKRRNEPNPITMKFSDYQVEKR